MSISEPGPVIDGKVSLPFSYSAGRTASRFFIELRDNRRIMGRKCPECGRVIVPSFLICQDCFVETADWVEVGPGGTLVTWTVVHRHQLHLPRRIPLAYGIVKLDGADTSMVHLLGEVEPDRISIGMRLTAVFSEERSGSLLDIAYFKPEGG